MLTTTHLIPPANFVPLTQPYEVGEQAILGRVVADMRRGNIDHCLVRVPNPRTGLPEHEVWRTNKGYLTARAQQKEGFKL